MFNVIEKLLNMQKVDETELSEERANLISRLEDITSETSLEEVFVFRKDLHKFWNKLGDFNSELHKKYCFYLTNEQHKIIDNIINTQSKMFRTRKCSPNSKYDKDYGLWIRTDKGQKPVDVKELQKHKDRVQRYKTDPKRALPEQRKRIIRQFSECKTINGFYGVYGFFINNYTHKRGYGANEYHHNAPQVVRDIVKMIIAHIDGHSLEFDNPVIDGNTLVFIKKSNKRNHYRDEQQWKEIIEFLKHNKVIKNVFFGIVTNKKLFADAKIRDKEWKFIENAGCREVENSVISNMKIGSGHFTTNYTIEGKVFEIL